VLSLKQQLTVMDQLRALRYFVEVAEQKSFAKAAKRFDVPASSISRRISDLESHLSTQLLIRNTRSVKLTELGQHYYQQTSRLILDLDKQDRLLKETQTNPSGRLSISSMVGFGERYLIPMLETFQQRYPDIELNVHLSDTLTKFGKDEVDIAIRGGYAPDERVVAIPLMSNHFVAAASKEYLDKYGAPSTTLDLVKHKGLFYTTPQGNTPWLTQVAGEWHNVSGKTITSSNHGKWLINQAIAGKGILMLPKWVLQEHFDRDELVELHFDHPVDVTQNSNFAVYMIYQKLDYAIPKIKVAVDFVREQMRDKASQV
jgi:DNA-binding transcriptional LysR family regulator